MTVPTYAGSIPSRSNSQSAFDTNVDALLTYIGGATASDLVPALNTDVAAVNSNAIAAAASEVAAAASAVLAAAVPDVEVYSAGTTYNAPDACVGSDGATYRCTGTSVSGDNPVGSVTGDWVFALATPIRYEEISATTTATYDIDATSLDAFYVEITNGSAATLNITDIPVGGRIRIVIYNVDGTVVWPAMAWSGGSAPAQSNNSDVYYIENTPAGFGSHSDNYMAYRVETNIS